MDKSDVIKGNPDLLDLSPLKAIKAYCMECGEGTYNEVKNCLLDVKHSRLCPLYQYRLGHKSNGNGRVFTDEERKAIAERFAKYRKNSGNPNDLSGDCESVYGSDETTSPEESDEDFFDSTMEEIYDEEDL